ncbi:uncharacterized protein LOC143493558 [Brachyhypopomus gauderio]|uniref:uncharacterized protein LOC143493558 n=1 Tax=Brachyhypopomus gauderio TaxID=698409 RepID=UPI004041D11F
MQDVDYMEEMDNPTNMRAVLSKLPYKMREKWKHVAFEILENKERRAKFADLVNYIERQAKIAIDPLFGYLQGASAPIGQKEKDMTVKKAKGNTTRSSSFVISIDTNKKKSAQSTQSAKTDQGKSKPETCVYCEKNHTVENCEKFKKQVHKDKIDFLRSKGLCFGCLVRGHLSKDCTRKLTCQVCSRKHPSILHVQKDETASVKDDKKSASDTQSISAVEQKTCGYTGAGNGECVLAIVPVRLKSKKGTQTLETYAFIDSGSSATFCTEKVMRMLNLRGRKTEILLRTMGQEKLVHSHILSDLEVAGLEENKYVDLPSVFTQPEIPVKKENIPQQKDLKRWTYLKEVCLPSINAEIGLLIGSNAHKAVEPWQVINSQGDGPYAVRTAMGWIVNGPLRRKDHPQDIDEGLQSFTVNRISVVSIEELLTQNFNTDFSERSCEDRKEMSQDDRRFMKDVEQSCQFIDGHYCISLPFRNRPVKMPSNRSLAEQRAINLKRKLNRNSQFHADYKAFMHDIIARGYAEKVPEESGQSKEGEVWYIPHHGVYHPKKKKIRVVFDCTATYQGVSLNNQLFQGPDLTNTLIGVLTRFREESVAVMADIEAMFYQVRVPPKDYDFLRFLWWPDGDLSGTLQEYRMTVHIFGATSSPSCACFALRKTAEDKKNETTAEAAKTIERNFYLDDCLTAVASEEQAISLSQSLKALCSRGGFNLTKWVSNSRRVLSCIPENERALEVKDLDLSKDTMPTERALGVQWCTESDTFRFKVNVPERPTTRRGILSIVNSVYDPQGLVAPCILPAKLILRELCQEKLSWDEEITERHSRRWLQWLSELQVLSDFRVDRCIKPKDFGPTLKAQIHNFSDASESGYGTASYILLTSKDGKKCCTLLMSKSRVAPLKKVTVPRMELTAAVIAVKVDKLLRREMETTVEESVFWTDSMTVLRYIENDASRFKTFVANRVAFIREATLPSQWRYVNSSFNPADVASRGMRFTSLIKNDNWIHGPHFLYKDEREWPTRPDIHNTMDEDSELRRATLVSLVSTAKVAAMTTLVEYYSDWHRLKKAVAWMLRLKDMLHYLVNKRKKCKAVVALTESWVVSAVM